MSKCTVAVTVDGWLADGDVAPTFQVGQAIGGTVDVWVTEPVHCDGLDVRLELKRTKKGYTLPTGSASQRLFAGEWQPGEYQYRFELPSTFPPTYDGHHVGWGWVALATVDIPWAMDPKGEAPFVLQAAASSGELLVQPPGPDNVQAGATSEGHQNLKTAAVMFVLALMAFAAGLMLKALELAHDDVSGGIAAVAMMASVGFGIWLGTAWWAQLKGGSRLRASVKLTPATQKGDYRSSAAQQMMVHCEVQTRGGGALERVVAHVIVRELVRWTERNPSTDSSTQYEYEHVYAHAEVPLQGDAASGLWSGELPFPELGPNVPPYTLFDCEGRGLLWQVDVHSYFTGAFGGTLDFGDGELSAVSSTSDMFIAVHDPTGAPLWTQAYGSDGDLRGMRVAVDPCGGVVVAGDAAGAVDFGDGDLAPIGGRDVLITRVLPP